MAASNNPVDVAALAELRPGMPVAVVEKALGSVWRALAPHKGGFIDILENTYGVIIRIDRKGMVGMIEFNSRFKHTIGGVPMGVELANIPTILPSMQIGDESKVLRGTRYGIMKLPEGVLTAQIINGYVRQISISNPDADYIKPTAPPYPLPSGIQGAPFSDPNLKLVVMSALLRLKIIDLGTPEQLASHVLGRPVDLEQEGYDLIPQAMDYLLRYPLTDEQLAAVDWIQFDGSGEIYPYAWYFWGGYEDAFDIQNSADLRLCINLQAISVISMTESFDLRTLVPLRKLEKIFIGVPAANIDALLDMPSLKAVSGFNANPEASEILKKLERRGIEVN